jgi:WhiB family redox-sensing transcriptional regulator
MTAPRALVLVGTRTPHVTARPGTAATAAPVAAVRPAGGGLRGAACADVDPDLWFEPDEDDFEDADGLAAAREFAERRARSICAGCPVREACLAGALKRREPYGIFGGLDAGERARLRYFNSRPAVVR